VSSAVLYQVDEEAGAMWAAGLRVDPFGFRPLALRREGASWVATEQPVTSGRLDDIAVKAPDDVWAVGAIEMDSPRPTQKPLVEHWDGSRWGLVPTPPLPDGASGSFSTVTAAGDALWVAGSIDRLTDSQQAVYRYDGHAWQSVSPDGLDTISYAWEVIPVSRHDVWMAGIGYRAAGTIMDDLARHFKI